MRARPSTMKSTIIANSTIIEMSSTAIPITAKRPSERLA